MKRWIIIVAVVAMAGWAVYDFVIKADSDNGKVGLERGNLAPDFELNTLDGEAVNLSDFKGERVLLNFWGTWCPPCRAEMPDMQKFHEESDVVILAVDALETEKSVDSVHNFVEEFGVTFRVLLDEKSNILTMYGIQSFPTTFLIDSGGKIQNKAIGPLNYEQMVQEFGKLK